MPPFITFNDIEARQQQQQSSLGSIDGNHTLLKENSTTTNENQNTVLSATNTSISTPSNAVQSLMPLANSAAKNNNSNNNGSNHTPSTLQLTENATESKRQKESIFNAPNSNSSLISSNQTITAAAATTTTTQPLTTSSNNLTLTNASQHRGLSPSDGGGGGGQVAPFPSTSAHYPQTYQASDQVPFVGCHLGTDTTHYRDRTNPEWAPVEPEADWPAVLEGKIVQASVSQKDWPYDHASHDFNARVEPFNGYEGLAGDKNTQRSEWGPYNTIETELEIGNRADRPWTQDTDNFPEYYWPSVNDTVWMMGRWVWDCGHSPANNSGNYLTEIHPINAIASTHPEPVIFRGDYAPSNTVKTKVYITSNGGYYDGQYAPLLRNYEFDINVPPAHSNEAGLRADVLSYRSNLGAYQPQFTYFPAESRVHVKIDLSPDSLNRVLNPRYVFNWDKVPGQDTEKLKNFLVSIFPKAGDTVGIPFTRVDHPDVSYFVNGDIKKIDDGNTIQIGPTCATYRGHCVGGTNFTSFITIDNTKSNAVVTFEVGRPVSPPYQNYSHYFRYPLHARAENGQVNIYDFDHMTSFEYGAIIAAGWEEHVLTRDYHLLKVTFDSAKINDAHAYDNFGGTPIHSPNTPARWRLWVSAGSNWLPGVIKGSRVARDCEQFNSQNDGVIDQDMLPINKEIEVIVPEDGGALHIQTAGWRSGCMDLQTMYMRTDPPDDYSLFEDYCGGPPNLFDFLANPCPDSHFDHGILCEDELSHCPGLPIGTVYKDYYKNYYQTMEGQPRSNDQSNHGIFGTDTERNSQGQSDNSLNYVDVHPDDPDAQPQGYGTAGDFTLNYHIKEERTFHKGEVVRLYPYLKLSIQQVKVLDDALQNYALLYPGYHCAGPNQNCRTGEPNQAALQFDIAVDVTTPLDRLPVYQHSHFPASGTLNVPLGQTISATTPPPKSMGSSSSGGTAITSGPEPNPSQRNFGSITIHKDPNQLLNFIINITDSNKLIPPNNGTIPTCGPPPITPYVVIPPSSPSTSSNSTANNNNSSSSSIVRVPASGFSSGNGTNHHTEGSHPGCALEEPMRVTGSYSSGDEWGLGLHTINTNPFYDEHIEITYRIIDVKENNTTN